MKYCLTLTSDQFRKLIVVTADCTGDRNRQHTLIKDLREPRLPQNEAFASILPERQHRLQACAVSEARDTLQAHLPT